MPVNLKFIEVRVFISIIFISSFLSGFAQKNKDQEFKDVNFISLKLHSGLVINNYIYFDSFPSRTPSALLELKIGKQTTGTKNWQQYYGYPQVGLSAFTGYLGNNRQLGFLFGLAPNVELNTRNIKKWAIKIKLGLGLAYFNKPYDSITNPYNILIGSHITALAIADFYFNRIITKKLNFEFGLSVLHASNGHTGLPNVGLNMVNANAGFKYYFDKSTTDYMKNTTGQFDNNLRFIFRIGIGVHKFGNELGPSNSPSYPVYDAAFYLAKQAGTLGSLQLGLGYKYYTSFYEKIVEDSIYTNHFHLKSSVLTLLLAYEFEMGQMSLLAQGGINFYNPFWPEFKRLINEDLTFYKKIEGVISTRLGLQYYFFDKEKFKKNIYLGLYIKANMGGADFVSIGTGFVF